MFNNDIRMKRSRILILLVLFSMIFPFRGRGEGAQNGRLQEERPFTLDDALSLEVLNFDPEFGISEDGRQIAYYSGFNPVRLGIVVANADGSLPSVVVPSTLVSAPCVALGPTCTFFDLR